MGSSPFAVTLAALRAPLRFAAEDDFARADRIQGLEGSVRAAAENVLALAIPRDARAVLTRVAALFPASLSDPERRAAIERALGLLDEFADPRWADAALERPSSALAGVGPKRAKLLERRGLGTVADLLFYLPSRYDDRRRLIPVGQLEVGRRATFLARVLVSDFMSQRGRGGQPRRVLQAVVGDDTGTVDLKWFRGGEAIHALLAKGTRLLVTGDVRRYRFTKELLHPEIEKIEDGAGSGEALQEALRQIVADYPTPEGIPPRTLRRYVQTAVAEYADLVPSLLPASALRARPLPEVAEALRAIHHPDPEADPEALAARRTPAHERLIREELYLLELGLALRRERRRREAGIVLAADGPRSRAALDALPFRLTGAQRRAVAEIRADLRKPHPMNRLLQGDVGSGKTAVAFLALLSAAESGCQGALMAPTELLAEQHERSLRKLAVAGGETTALRIALLTASVSRRDAEQRRRALAASQLDLVVGTHALLQEGVRFANLGLAVIDEQHRFGVLQRAALSAGRSDGRVPHMLVMTATPIPRTLALTLYGELDVTVLDEMPPGRTPVRTERIREGQGGHVMTAIREALARQEQVYVVYPLVEESEKIDLRNVAESAARIARAFPEARVDLVHGRLDAPARAEAMARFERGETQILVATTVIEVGVDVPNATVMVIEHAERFGLAQLHQLRGRVGRGERPGRCLLVARGFTADSEARLTALLDTTDGFAIADADLRIRGPGEFLGTRQSGRLPDLRLADLVRDAALVPWARSTALDTVARDPGLLRAPALLRAVQRRWGSRLALADVG
ncbi:ATP-dependent DNA helicase RecG [Myxococcota bacterium]|nr:ATP-dependent DNA helicase RecG [Myxococcota bacterium]MCZ7619487.1 ATP-dependent DNA helicase RecG [Myxococcota bacterium]